MRELTEDVIIRAVKNSPNDAKTIILRKLGLGKCGEKVVTKAELIDLSQNDLQTVSELFAQFPSGWWFNLSGNVMIDEFAGPTPYSLGLLDLSDTQIKSLDSLNSLSNTVILRFNIPLSRDGAITRSKVLQKIHNIWVLNDDFIKSDELTHISALYNPTIVSDNLNEPLLSTYNHSSTFNAKIPTEREQDLIEILTKFIPSKISFSEFYRLDLVCDDYSQQTHLFNNHPDVRQGIIRRLPTVNWNSLFTIPHKIRLDLTALLTAGILFSLPKSLFTQTIELLLLPYVSVHEIHDLMEVPVFVKTGIISLCRRICQKELQEYELNGYLSAKPPCPSLIQEPILQPNDLLLAPPVYPTNMALPPRDLNGFRFLSFLRSYLLTPLERNRPPLEKDSLYGSPFSEMELDLLKYLPDIPTIASCPIPSSAAYRDWVSLTARHSVILMSRSPNCPSLTRSQRSVAHEQILTQLQPILVAAGMTYEDLEITTTGPTLDGRTGITSNVLSFGRGVPKGQAGSLSWNVNGASREYQKPWIVRKSSKPTDEGTKEYEIQPTIPFVTIENKTSSDNTGELADDLISIGDSFFSSKNSEDLDGELCYPLTSASLQFVTRAEVKKGRAESDSESLKSRESVFNSLRKQDSRQYSTTGISEIAHELNIGAPAGIRPWDSRSYQRSLEAEASPKTVSGYSVDNMNVPVFALGTETQMKLSALSEWSDISKPPVLLHPLSKVPLIRERETDPQSSLSPIEEEQSHSASTKRLQSNLTELNLQRLPNSRAISRSNSISTHRHADSSRYPSRKNSIERMDSASSMGSWKSISRTPSGMISRCDSASSTGINLQNMSPLERKLMKKHILALKQHRDETQKWLNGFQNNLQESFQSGPDELDIKNFFLAIDETEERLLAKTMDSSSHHSSEIDFSYSISEAPSIDQNDQHLSHLAVYKGKPAKDLKEQLLKDMGTIRNINQLAATNRNTTKWIKEQKRMEESRKNRRGYLISKSGGSPYSIQSQDSDLKPRTSRPQLPSLSWASFVRNPSPNEKHPDIFLTESDTMSSSITPSLVNETEEQEKLETVLESEPRDQIAHRNESNHKLQTTIDWDPHLTLTQQLRKTINYEKLYTNQSEIEWGHIGASGKLTSTWYPHPDKVVYTLDPNAPIDIARNEIIAKSLKSPTSPEARAKNEPLTKIPIKPTVYRNKFLTPKEQVHYESIGTTRILSTHPSSQQPPRTDINTKTPDDMSNSVLSHTVILSPQHSMNDALPGEIDLHSLGEEKVSSLELKIAITRADNEEFRKADDGTEIVNTYSRLNTPLISVSPTHGRIPSVNTLEQLLSGLPPVNAGSKKIRDASARSKSLVVRVDPELPIDLQEKVSVIKPATNKLQLNKNFKQTIPRSFREECGN